MKVQYQHSSITFAAQCFEYLLIFVLFISQVLVILLAIATVSLATARDSKRNGSPTSSYKDSESYDVSSTFLENLNDNI